MEKAVVEKGLTLVVVADGGGGRAFAETRRHGPLRELPLFDEANRARSEQPHAHAGAVYSRGGSGRDNVNDDSPSERREQDWLRAIAEATNRAASHYEHIVLMAPARALGLLRAGLNKQTTRIVELEEARDRRSQSVDEIRSALKHLRMPA